MATPSLTWRDRITVFLSYILTANPSNAFSRFVYNLVATHTLPDATPIEGVEAADVIIDPSRNLWFRVFTPTETKKEASLPVIIYFHGGGFVYDGADSSGYDLIGRRMSLQTPAVVVSVNYRLAPKYRCPAQYEDGLDAIRYVDNCPNIDGLAPNADLSRCFILGDSAGGNIAHHVTRRISETQSEYQTLRVIGLLELQPFYGSEERTPSELRLINAPLLNIHKSDELWGLFLPEGSNRDNQAANVTGPNAVDISGLDFPATLVVVGGFDPTQDHQRAYVAWLIKSGKEAYRVEYPRAVHGFYSFTDLPETSEVFTEVVYFIRKRLDKLKYGN